MSEILYKAGKYIRKSYTDDKNKESESVSNQRKIIDSYINGQDDIEAVEEYVDDGVSGIIFDRPAFKKMMNDIENGLINCVIVKDLSRLGRDFSETGRYLRRIFPAFDVRFIALGDNVDTLKDSADNLVVSVKSAINDAYSRDISKKIRSALNVKRENGDYVGACPIYGYKKDENNHNLLVIDELPASIVRDIFRLKVDGMSALKIAEHLNSLGVLSPLSYKKDRGLPHPKKGFADVDGAAWSPHTIIRILKDETYTGALVQGRKGTLNYKLKNVIDKPESEWKRVDDTHEAIVPKHIFDLAQKIMRLDTRSAPGSDKVYMFSGILICGSCGARMTRKSVPYKDTKHIYYYCPVTKKRGCLTGVNVKESDLTGCILNSVKSHIANIASIDTLISTGDSQRIASGIIKQCKMQIEENEQQIAHDKSMVSTLYENLINGIITKDDYKSLKAKYSKQEADKLNAIKILKEKIDNVLEGKAERLRWMEHFTQFDNLTELDRRAVINLINSIIVKSKDEITITFNFQDEYKNALQLIKTIKHNESFNTGKEAA